MSDQFRTIDSAAWREAVKRARAERNEVSERIKTLMRQGGAIKSGVGVRSLGDVPRSAAPISDQQHPNQNNHE